jgi:AcrR family transcriptional regulator
MRDEQHRTVDQIARALDVSVKTVRLYFTDPDQAGLRARRRRYAGRCDECGRATDGSRGRANAPRICAICSTLIQREQASFQPEEILVAIALWYGLKGVPPRASQWRTRIELAKHVDNPQDWPLTATVQDRFVRWNLALSSAGVPTLAPGSYPRGRVSDGSSTLSADAAPADEESTAGAASR